MSTKRTLQEIMAILWANSDQLTELEFDQAQRALGRFCDGLVTKHSLPVAGFHTFHEVLDALGLPPRFTRQLILQNWKDRNKILKQVRYMVDFLAKHNIPFSPELLQQVIAYDTQRPCSISKQHIKEAIKHYSGYWGIFICYSLPPDTECYDAFKEYFSLYSVITYDKDFKYNDPKQKHLRFHWLAYQYYKLR